MYWIPPSLPLQSLSCTTPTVCRTDEGTFGRVYADVITNFPSSIGFQFLQERRLREQLLAHSKPGLPVTILALWCEWWWWRLSSFFSTSFRLAWAIKLGFSKYSFCQHTALKTISVHFLTLSGSSDFRYWRPSWFHMYRKGVGVYSGGRREGRKNLPLPL